MSKFEDNPFGEPIDNPFAVRLISSSQKFAFDVWFFFYSQDPAVQQQARIASSNNVILDNYTPFDDEDKTRKSQYNEGSNNLIASQGTVPSQIPAYNQSSTQSNQVYGAAPQISTAELQVCYVLQPIRRSITHQD